ncbi:hypothetical protein PAPPERLAPAPP_00720 [Brevundimonas phage vB_BpoS-Papperlapapp]|uniref:Uncharacterized protein n=1 Tax=Brevundimonas phage vB_BpoS-Domovoi TaxID=2948598 RepID=A0A9E7MRA7_9CAUD|nr:hypothetical protein DOMOVOI_05490 [Brevundimonas phage vB_BpoS-Domovoi]USN15814.1 hypothetical protein PAPPERLAPAPP_00720 [Brevundimonas phage vB_BpoS-Papperlapapp]
MWALNAILGAIALFVVVGLAYLTLTMSEWS